ncbi:MAG TPA: hypothetical protein VHC63_17485 [Acidimicrobiales bacterium]|nr:hypothetical protein [Acidimicrobiales bacterium]
MFKRSIPSISGLLFLVLAVGFVAAAYMGLPMWFPVAFAVAVIGLQYLINPFIIQKPTPCRPRSPAASTPSAPSPPSAGTR